MVPKAADLPVITFKEVSRHNSVKDAWIAVAGRVFDITEFIRTHPGMNGAGGATSTIVAIMNAVGKDCTEDFRAIHSGAAWVQLEEYCIGRLEESGCPPSEGRREATKWTGFDANEVRAVVSKNVEDARRRHDKNRSTKNPSISRNYASSPGLPPPLEASLRPPYSYPIDHDLPSSAELQPVRDTVTDSAAAGASAADDLRNVGKSTFRRAGAGGAIKAAVTNPTRGGSGVIDSSLRPVPSAELSQHGTSESAWVAVSGVVYDITDLLRQGALGSMAMAMLELGTDCTNQFANIPALQTPLLQNCAVGRFR